MGLLKLIVFLHHRSRTLPFYDMRMRVKIFKEKRDEKHLRGHLPEYHLGRAAPILNSRRYFIMRWGNCASLLVMSSDYEFMA